MSSSIAESIRFVKLFVIHYTSGQIAKKPGLPVPKPLKRKSIENLPISPGNPGSERICNFSQTQVNYDEKPDGEFSSRPGGTFHTFGESLFQNLL
jgi:hypothetical protein